MTTQASLKFITCGSVDDGKSTLIGRLLVDSRTVMQDQLAGVSKSGEVDLAQFTDGLSAEREQGITIDVAYRYFSTPSRKFIIGDAPGHEQYTRNMVTAASSADAAVVLVDATKLNWQSPQLALLPQTRRHSLLLKLLRVPHIVFAVNKLDALADDDALVAFTHIGSALRQFAQAAQIAVDAIIPISALRGDNVITPNPGWCGYGVNAGETTLLAHLEQCANVVPDTHLPLAFPVQWVEKFAASSQTDVARRVFWGRAAAGIVRKGQPVKVLPSGQTATIAKVLTHAKCEADVPAGSGAGIVLDRELDVSRGDWLLAEDTIDSNSDSDITASTATPAPQNRLNATVAWLDDEPMVAGRTYWALHGHKWVKAKVIRLHHQLNIETLERNESQHLAPNAIGDIEVALQEALPLRPYQEARAQGALILVDTATNRTSGALMVL